jgi:hypothetical protein
MQMENWYQRKSRHTIQRERVDVFAVITASHVLLAETNSVLSGRNTIKDLEVSFRDALTPEGLATDNCVARIGTYPAREIDLHGEDTNILWAGHVILGRRRGSSCRRNGHDCK